MRNMPISGAAAALSLHVLLAASMAIAVEPEAEETPEPETAAVEKAVVEVRDSLPFIPNSNTIATKLPVELKWTPTNVGVVTSEVISEQNDRVLGEARRTSAE